MEHVLGIDIGSSATKVGLFSLDGAPFAVTSKPYPTLEPQRGYREQDPEFWWLAVIEGIREVCAGIPRESILAIGTTGHISSLTFVDEGGKPLRSAVDFQDQRAVAEAEELYGEFGRAELARHFGIDLPPAATWPLPRLLWFRGNEPHTLDKAHYLLQAKDFINYRLTGEFGSDASSSRGLVHQTSWETPRALFRRLSLPENLTPSMFDPTAIIGRLSAAASALTGLPAGIPVTVGWNDLNTSVLGSGVVEPGRSFNIAGTSEHIGVVAAGDCTTPELVCGPFLPGSKLLYGVTSCGGGSLEWYRNAFRRNLKDLAVAAAAAPPGCDGLLFLPYLEGERSPIWDASASGAFLGLRGSHTEGHFVRAILEGVSFSLRQNFDIVGQHAWIDSSPMVLSGGAARMALWNQIKSDVLGMPVVVADCVHAGALGAAMLGAVATRAFDSCEAAARAMARCSQQLEPNSENRTLYATQYQRYQELYPALKIWFAGANKGAAACSVRTESPV